MQLFPAWLFLFPCYLPIEMLINIQQLLLILLKYRFHEGRDFLGLDLACWNLSSNVWLSCLFFVFKKDIIKHLLKSGMGQGSIKIGEFWGSLGGPVS